MKKQILISMIFMYSISFLGAQDWDGEDGGDIYYTDGNVGIGTDEPSKNLDVDGDVQITDELNVNGSIGVGSETTSFSYPLELNINQDTRTRIGVVNKNTGASAQAGVTVRTDSVGVDLLTFGSGATGTIGGFTKANSACLRTHSGNPADRFVIGNGGNAPIFFITNDAARMTITKSSGYVGIGTTSPSCRLDVSGPVKVGHHLFITGNSAVSPTISYNYSELKFWDSDNSMLAMLLSTETDGTALLQVDGKIEAEEIEVTDVDLADYVFANDYELKSLDEVEAFIQENSHLPRVPSAQEVAENGMNVGEFQNILLEKVEELTLYMIDLQKDKEELSSVVAEQQKQIEELKTLLLQIAE